MIVLICNSDEDIDKMSFGVQVNEIWEFVGLADHIIGYTQMKPILCNTR